MRQSDVVIFGTGNFAARILFDLASTASDDISVTVAGRDSARLAWLRTAAMARVAMFGTRVRVTETRLETLSTEAVVDLLDAVGPRLVVNTASVIGGRKTSVRPDRWAQLLQTAGFGVATLLQARISL